MVGQAVRAPSGFWLFRLGLLCLLTSLGCGGVNVQSAARLSQQALQATQSLSVQLEGTRQGLLTYVEGQALASPLIGTEPLSKSALCHLQSVQQSLRLRLRVVGKLSLAYEHMQELTQAAQQSESESILDNLMVELDRADYLTDPPLVEGCPEQPSAASPKPPELSQPALVSQPGLRVGLSKGKTLELASQKIRLVLAQLVTLLRAELPLYVSVQQQQLQSRQVLARALLVRGLLTPGELLTNQLAGLGLRWDELAFSQQSATFTAQQKKDLQAALVAALQQRGQQLRLQEAARLEQHVQILEALARQHVSLERGQPLDFRTVAALLVPVLQSINLPSSSSGGASVCPTR